MVPAECTDTVDTTDTNVASGSMRGVCSPKKLLDKANKCIYTKLIFEGTLDTQHARGPRGGRWRRRDVTCLKST